MRPGDSKTALSSFVSGLITSAANLRYVTFMDPCSYGQMLKTASSHMTLLYIPPCSVALGNLVGGALTTFMSVPMSAVIIAEIFGAQVSNYIQRFKHSSLLS